MNWKKIHGSITDMNSRSSPYFIEIDVYDSGNAPFGRSYSGFAETDSSVSELVNEAVREALAEDAEDLAAFEDREKEPELMFEDVVKDLKRRGKI